MNFSNNLFAFWGVLEAVTGQLDCRQLDHWGQSRQANVCQWQARLRLSDLGVMWTILGLDNFGHFLSFLVISLCFSMFFYLHCKCWTCLPIKQLPVSREGVPRKRCWLIQLMLPCVILPFPPSLDKLQMPTFAKACIIEIKQELLRALNIFEVNLAQYSVFFSWGDILHLPQDSFGQLGTSCYFSVQRLSKHRFWLQVLADCQPAGMANICQLVRVLRR